MSDKRKRAVILKEKKDKDGKVTLYEFITFDPIDIPIIPSYWKCSYVGFVSKKMVDGHFVISSSIWSGADWENSIDHVKHTERACNQALYDTALKYAKAYTENEDYNILDLSTRGRRKAQRLENLT